MMRQAPEGLISLAHKTTDLAIITWHGFGATADDLYPIAEDLGHILAPQHTTIICPQAPTMTVTMDHMRCPAWCDIMDLKESAPTDFAGLTHQLAWLHPWIESTLAPLHPKHTLHLGFSQGGAMAATYAAAYPCDGLIMLSSYWPSMECTPSCPILWQHGHRDPVLPLDWVLPMLDQIKHPDLTFQTYDTMHTVAQEQYAPLIQWCKTTLGIPLK